MYFDYAAATPLEKRVITAMEPYFTDEFYNPSAPYSGARQVKNDYQNAKHRIAQVIGAREAEIIMTAGATESINLAINGFFGQSFLPSEPSVSAGNFPKLSSDNFTENPRGIRVPKNDLTKKIKIITSAIEHPAVLNAAKAVNGKILPVDKFGRIDIKMLEKGITDDTVFVSIGYANNEIGTVQPIKEIAEIIAKVRENRAERNIKTPIYFHTDASQAPGMLDINVARLGVDMMTLNAGKCYGPKQVGCLYVRAGVELSPLIYGGGQESGLRSGTENVAGTVGFATALEIAEKKRKTEVKRLEVLRSDLDKFIISFIPGAVVNGHKKYRLPNIINFSVPGLDAERAVFALDQKDIQVATGSACSANKGNRSHVLKAIGLSDEMADGSIRISFGRGTAKTQIEKLKPVLVEVIENEKKLS